MGVSGYKQLLVERKEAFVALHAQLSAIATAHGQRVLVTKNNGISMALSLVGVGTDENVTFLGSMLFARCVSGTRVISSNTMTVCGISFKNFGAHIDDYPCPYLTAAASIGVRASDIPTFVQRLDKTLQQFMGKYPRAVSPPALAAPDITVAAAPSI